ncbi:unnamed protein product [Caenorhabditis angaria]|uniref:Uncharacterized protein n=1 Tax=Caenorhabditis angaria TaxID=860376 RepID=A0A9P1I3I7_9PELO|nr:unnamed protein product [Caenorhabditis angaria]
MKFVLYILTLLLLSCAFLTSQARPQYKDIDYRLFEDEPDDSENDDQNKSVRTTTKISKPILNFKNQESIRKGKSETPTKNQQPTQKSSRSPIVEPIPPQDPSNIKKVEICQNNSKDKIVVKIKSKESNRIDSKEKARKTLNIDKDEDLDEIMKLVKKYKTKKDFAIVPKSNKQFYQLDQMIRPKAKSIIILNATSHKTFKSPIIPTTPSTYTSIDSREDVYDFYPKLSEVLKLPPEDIYKGNTDPEWMTCIEPTDEDLKDVEGACTVGSEQIEMYHSKQFELHVPPKITNTMFDPWILSINLKSRDDDFFTPPLVFSNTIRSLINTAGAKTEYKKKVPTKTNEMKLSIVDVDRTKCFTYTRTNAIETASKRIYMKIEEIPKKQDLSIYSSKFQQK